MSSARYVVVACTQKNRWFDIDSERGPGSPNTHARLAKGINSRPANGKKAMNPNNNYGTMDEVETAGAPPLDCWIHDDAPDADVWTIPTAPYAGSHYATFPPALPRRLINLMCPRLVCTICGEPRRRIVSDRSAFDRQPELAAHIRSQRKALGFSLADVNSWFGYAPGTHNWELTNSAAGVPNVNDWPILKERLNLSDDFDDIVLGERRWTESTIQYVGGQRGFNGGREMGRGGHQGMPKADRVAPDEWSDCGHNTWRRGIVCDPFCGSGTTLQAASELGRDSIGIDLDRRNLELARSRLGMFLVEEDEVPA